MASNRGLPSVRISSGLISRSAPAPSSDRHNARHSPAVRGFSVCKANMPARVCRSSPEGSSLPVAVATSMIRGSDNSTSPRRRLNSSPAPRQISSSSSTSRTSRLPVRSAVRHNMSTASLRRLASAPSADMRSTAVRSSSASSASLAASSPASRDIVSRQKPAKSAMSWHSSMKRAGSRRAESAALPRNSAAVRASNIDLPMP